jgi:hypothetical protein
MPIKTIVKYSNIFVETGALVGDGIQLALNAGYDKVYSIELYDKFYNICKQRFYDNNSVEIIKGDSALVLGDVIKNINQPITFWLDGHFSGEGTGFGISEFPILEELEHIKSHQLNTHILLIDDIRCWKNYSETLNYKSVINYIKTINQNYSFYTMDGHIVDDILVCKLD